MAVPLTNRLRVSRDRLQCGAARMTRFVADEIDGSVPAMLADHVNGCGRCRADARRARLVAHGLAVLRQEQALAPAGFLAAVSANLDRRGVGGRDAFRMGGAPQTPPKRGRRSLAAGAGAVAATSLTVAAVRHFRADF